MDETESDVTVTEKKKGFELTEKVVNDFLRTIGLVQPIDYIFMDYAMTTNRKLISLNKEPLHFLFHVIMGGGEEERPFPYCSFLELASSRHASVSEAGEEEFKTIQRYIIYNFCPSETWDQRTIHSFADFHLYFLDVIKPIVNQSAEELYQVIDIKRGETFFLMFGNHQANEKIIVLFVTAKQIIAFHIPRPQLNPDEYGYPCKWISLEIPCVSLPQTEFAIFELPEHNLVLTEQGLDTKRKQWQEAFGDPNLMDLTEDSNEEKSIFQGITSSLEEPHCDSCGS